MKKSTKRFLTLTLALVMVLSFGLTSVAVEISESPNTITEEDMQMLLDKWNSILQPETPFADLEFFAPDESFSPCNNDESVEYEYLFLDEMSEEEIGVAIERLLDGDNVLLRETRNEVIAADDTIGIAPVRWMAGVNGTHQWVTTWAIQYLYSTGYLRSYTERLSESERGYLISYSDWPDSYETSNTNDWHFYNYQTKMNYYNNGYSTENAKTRFIYWYGQAVNSYWSGQTALAFQNLGKSIHYLSDINTPVHTGDNFGNPMGAAAQLARHVIFESRANNDKNSVRRMPDYLNLSLYENSSINTIAEQASAFSFQHYMNLGDSAASHYQVYYPTLNASIVDVMGILYRFWYDTDGLYRHPW